MQYLATNGCDTLKSYFMALNILYWINATLNVSINDKKKQLNFRNQQDQFENLAAHTHKGIDFLDKYGSFVRDRCAIEVEYAAKLR